MMDEMDCTAADLIHAYGRLYNLPKVKKLNPSDQVDHTPQRTVQALFELFEGCDIDPVIILDKQFNNEKYDEMVYVNEIAFVSMCAHHTLPFLGKVYFAYTPHETIVGLSKIPRFIEALAHRPQIQEQLTAQIADTFMECVKPYGCGVVIEAWHTCMMIRGPRKDAYTKTTAMRGSFKQDPTRSEFLNGIRKTSEQIWP